ncbi:hypothetical protein [Komagataeibacter rhaeticus]|uniref:hypothetical protein n=1 Tax=Komagataeibacter rhaeticus TaxID=215221 RepID=UPI0039E98CBB
MLPPNPPPPEAPKAKIKPPTGDLSNTPDKATKAGLCDYTNPKDANDRVFYLNLYFFKYGTNDKVHAASLLMSLILLFMIFWLLVIGLYSSNDPWKDKLFSWLGSAFTFISGVAIGRGVNGSKSDD